MIFTIIDNTKNINIELEVIKIRKNNPNFIYKPFHNKLEFQLVFVYGGDGTYLNFIKENINKDIKIILMHCGKLSFLNSIYEYEEIKLEDFKQINYLEYTDQKQAIPFINECEIFFERINEFNFYINDLLFKKILSSRFFCITSLGSTGLARSRQYPLFLDNQSYIFDILDEPKYHYYKALSQPLLLSINQSIKLEINKEPIDYVLKIDNQVIESKTNKINITNKKTICSIYNTYNIFLLSKKIGELF